MSDTVKNIHSNVVFHTTDLVLATVRASFFSESITWFVSLSLEAARREYLLFLCTINEKVRGSASIYSYIEYGVHIDRALYVVHHRPLKGRRARADCLQLLNSFGYIPGWRGL